MFVLATKLSRSAGRVTALVTSQIPPNSLPTTWRLTDLLSDPRQHWVISSKSMWLHVLPIGLVYSRGGCGLGKNNRAVIKPMTYTLYLCLESKTCFTVVVSPEQFSLSHGLDDMIGPKARTRVQHECARTSRETCLGLYPLLLPLACCGIR